ncbi:MAG: hypothetical protein ACI30R_05645, partial [Sodaliphilus sp.]
QKYTGILQYELECEMVFLYLVLGQKEKAMALWENEPLRKYAENLKSCSTAKWRLMWALAKYEECDEAKAQQIFTHIKTHASEFLMTGEVKSDIAIITHLTTHPANSIPDTDEVH